MRDRRFRPRTFEDSAAHDDLRYWGYWKGLQFAADGYSPENTIAQLLSGRSNGCGHRVLCLDMKPRAWEINAKVFSLPRELIEVLIARYCLPMDENGQPYLVAPLLGISFALYVARLEHARLTYKRLIFPQVLLAS